MHELFEQDFNVRVDSLKRHASYSYDERRFVVCGTLQSYCANHWGAGDFQWGFRVIILNDEGTLRPELFKPRDSSGAYSEFFRALVWRRLPQVLAGRLV